MTQNLVVKMKSLIVLILLIPTSLVLSQNLAISVTNKSLQPLPCAYILVNNKPITVCDSTGIALIPLDKLKINDTIGVSYLGALPAWILFNESVKNNRFYKFQLDESDYKLTEIVVSYKDGEKLFRKSVNQIPPLNFYCKMEAKMTAIVQYNGDLSYQGFGIIRLTNDKNVPHYWPWFGPPVIYISESDTTGIWKTMNNQIHIAINLSNLSLWRWQYRKKLKNYYTYLGEQNNFKVFRIVYPGTYLKDWNYQIIFNVDKNTKDIRSVKVEALKENASGNTERITLVYDCEIFVNNIQKKKQVYLPDNIHYTYERSNYEHWNIYISDVSLSF